jgi:hypothetical protein
MFEIAMIAIWNYVYLTLLDKDKLYATIHFMKKKNKTQHKHSS